MNSEDLTDAEIDELLTEYDKTDPKLQRRIIAQFVINVMKLQAFKDWVHKYLDDKGIPHHPPGVHGAEGCRIGDRMDYVFARFKDQ